MRRLRGRLCTVRRAGDDGNATVEFLGLTVVVLLPVAYLVLTLGRLQAAVFATEGAAREAARVFVAADDDRVAVARARVATGLALTDQGFDDDPAGALSLACSAAPCLTPGATVTARVQVTVPLPFVPAVVQDALPLAILVTASRSAVVDSYRETR